MLAEGWDLKNSVSSLKSMDLLSKPDNKKDSKTNEILLTHQETLAPGEWSNNIWQRKEKATLKLQLKCLWLVV